jgi:hypothetical protein
MTSDGYVLPGVETYSARRPFLHPLVSARFFGLLRTLVQHGGASPRFAAQIGLMASGGVFRWPLCLVESLRVASRIKHVTFDPAPVFIIGHWRSGTTYLHNLMSSDPAFAFPTITDTLRPYEFYPGPIEFISRKLLLRNLPKTRPMDDVPLREGLPQEEELALASMAAPSFLNCFYFPEQMRDIFAREVLFEGGQPDIAKSWSQALLQYLAKISILCPGRRLLLKNPANSARIRHLKRLFPKAKFIHIHRDPLDVYASTCKLYQRMLPMLALQDYDPASIGNHVLWSYGKLMDALFAGMAELPQTDQIEVSYQELLGDPRGTLERIYSSLELGPFADVSSALADSIDTFSGMSPAASPRSGPAHAVRDALTPYRARLGYQ